MVAEWDIPSAKPVETGTGPQVMAVVPLPSDAGGSSEILVMSAFGNLKLPAGEIQPRESSLQAVRRVVRGTTGVRVNPERLVYVIEQPGRPLALCVLCGLVEDDEADTKPGVRFASIAGSDGEFEPSPLRELLIEDIRSGFVRGVAHVVVSFDDDGREQRTVIW
jgi:ADP-ribose pyrophosphatase YjhB (NUDIX family)